MRHDDVVAAAYVVRADLADWSSEADLDAELL
jgi:hypothetical protein